MNSINVMILSAGRRVELIQRFKRAAKNLGIVSEIVAVDINKQSPALYFADSYYIVPRIGSDDYIQCIINLCVKKNIKLIVPTIDTELSKLALFKEEIESSTNAKVLVSDKNIIDICDDKIKTHAFFENNGFGVPQLIDYVENEVYKFPLFIKPKNGSSSINAFKVNCYNELRFFMEYISEPIVQEFISGAEYSVDVFCDFEGNPITVVPRLRIAVRNGEILKGKIVKDKEIITDVLKVLHILKPIGQLTIQCMKCDEGIRYIEINPRFGGGSPMSIDAGADSCENLYRILKGDTLKYNENYSDGDLFLRFDNSIHLNEKMQVLSDV